MNREDITLLIAEYEDSHRVADYMVGGWHVWPILRLMACWRFYRPRGRLISGPGSESGCLRRASQRRCVGAARRLGRLVLCGCKAMMPRLNGRVTWLGRKSDIVVLTRGDRLQRIGSLQYNYISDPFVEAAVAGGLSCAVWQLDGIATGLRRVETAYVGPMVKSRSFPCVADLRSVLTMRAPAWFAEFEFWWRAHLGAPLRWAGVMYRIGAVSALSHTFETWLAAVGCRAVVLDCYYGWDGMAAALAASRLGVLRMDLQHGLQGRGHFAYSGWRQSPANGYECMPDTYWVWGSDDASQLCESNPGMVSEQDVLIGGNLWLNKWRNERCGELSSEIADAQRLVAGHRRTVLVTLQKGIEYRNSVLPAIAKSPKDWLWLIRLHRSDVGILPTVEREVCRLGDVRVNVQMATQMPLYALLSVCSWHMTWFSTCALEALAFGVPTVLLHPSGAAAYRRCIDRGVMIYCGNPTGVVDALRSCEGISPQRCRVEAEHAFAPLDASERALSMLVDRLVSVTERSREPTPQTDAPAT